MIRFSKKDFVKQGQRLLSLFSTREISLRSLKNVAFVALTCLTLEALFFWRSAYLAWCSGRKELNWQTMLQAEPKNTGEAKILELPTLDQLPAMLDQCCRTFHSGGVDVYSFNVERFGELKESAQDPPAVDYSLVRLKLRGSWEGMMVSLKKLEEMEELSIHAQEIALKPEEGEMLLRIDFCRNTERDIPSSP